MSNNGEFSGNPKTEWLVDPVGADRDMRLIEDFWYIDPDGKKWLAPAQSVINGASIPRSLWAKVGSPYTDDYRRASIVHDVACGNPAVPRKDADVMFLHACRAGGCPVFQAWLLYVGVRLGSWITGAKHIFQGHAFAKDMLLARATGALSDEEQGLQKQFSAIAADLAGLPEDASVEQLDAVIDKHARR